MRGIFCVAMVGKCEIDLFDNLYIRRISLCEIVCVLECLVEVLDIIWSSYIVNYHWVFEMYMCVAMFSFLSYG